MAISKVQFKANANANPVVWMDATPATASASNIISPYTAMLANGIVTQGTGSGGGGGLEYETGTYTPSSDVSSASISFTNTHTTRPFCVIMADTTETLANANSILLFGVSSWYDVFGTSFYITESAVRYARILYDYKTSTGAMQSNIAITELTGTNSTAFPYWITESGFYAYTTVTTRYFISGRTYKWVAVWKPTT